jgi:DNA polymerase III delta prime subunit
MNYNLAVLNDKEFENLCKDLLENLFAINLHNFKKGKDKGIDLRFAGRNNNEIVVQAKHYVNSKFSDLKYRLTKHEKPNIDKLIPPPERYILATSLPLSPQDVDLLLKEMHPYIKSADDIIGRDQLESLISGNKKIEEKYYKLWITSTPVLLRILHNGAKGRSEFYREKILKKVGLYVQTINFENALHKLTENNFLIISGEPGVGKTTIAYLLICNLLANDYELIHIEDNLRTAGDLISPDPEHKQIFFFDDFLGSNIYELTNPRNTESAIVSFIERIKMLKNKYLILTTRTTILNHADYLYEKFKREKFSSISKYELTISDYSQYNRAEILYNHLYQSNMREGLYETIVTEKNYHKIINHKNYSPRLIEFITESQNFKNSSIETLNNFIFFNLDNPQEIWRDAYEKQLGDIDRFMLTCLFSLGGYSVPDKTLKLAFHHRYAYEIANNGFRLEHNAYESSLKKLLDGFIKSVKLLDTGTNLFSFINPSVGDFLLNYLKSNEAERWRILNGTKFTTQLTNLFNPNRNKLGITIKEQQDYFKTFTSTAMELIPNEYEVVSIDVGYIYFTLFNEYVTEELILVVLKNIISQGSAQNQFDELVIILQKCSSLLSCKIFILKYWWLFGDMLYSGVREAEDFKKINNIFELYQQSLSDFINNGDNLERIEQSIRFCFDEVKKEIDFSSGDTQLIDRFYEVSESYAAQYVSDKYWERYIEFLEECGLSSYYDNLVFDLELNEIDIVQEAVRNFNWENEREDHFMESSKDPEQPLENVDLKIDRLFEQ